MIPRHLIVSDLTPFLGPGDVDHDEVLDLTMAALLEDNALLERSRLVSRQFVSARTFTWLGSESDICVNITITEFASPEQSILSVEDLRDRLQAAAIAVGTDPFSVTASYRNDPPESVLTVMSEHVGSLQMVIVIEGDVHAAVANRVGHAQAQLLRSMKQSG
jgi:hypothetical protein